MGFLVVTQKKANFGSLNAEVVEFSNSAGSSGGNIQTSLKNILSIQVTAKNAAVQQVAGNTTANIGEVAVKTPVDINGYATIIGF